MEAVKIENLGIQNITIPDCFGRIKYGWFMSMDEGFPCRKYSEFSTVDC
jgi:hypothetical protein